MQPRQDVPLTENPTILARMKALEKFSVSTEGLEGGHFNSLLEMQKAMYAFAQTVVTECAKEKNSDVGRCVAALDACLSTLHQAQLALLMGKYR